MNTVIVQLFSMAMHRFAQRRQVRLLEQTISMFIRLWERDPERLFVNLIQFSKDSRWVLRYIAGRELYRFLQAGGKKAAEIWFTLADDDNLYVREGAAKGIVAASAVSFDEVWSFWEKAFSHPSDKVRQTAALTFIKLWEIPFVRERLLSVYSHLQSDSSAKVNTIVKTHIAPLLGKNDKPVVLTKHYVTTEELPVPSRLIDQVIGQERAVDIIKLAARQKRSVLLIGEPGTGKSMLAKAMSELLPASSLEDIIVELNEEERNVPRVRRLPAGEAERIIKQREKDVYTSVLTLRWIVGFACTVSLFVSVFYSVTRDNPIYIMGGLFAIPLFYWFGKTIKAKSTSQLPKFLVNHRNTSRAPFIDATGLHAGALLGDVRHDPYQSGGLEAMPHHLVEPGAIHLAHNGVLFIDEVSTLSLESQQSLLTAFQEKKLSITGLSPGSSGTMIRTEPVPCDFLMVLAGNLSDVDKIHPALRSRIRGYGYEIYMKTTMDDTEENRYKLALFVAQEVRRDGKIPHFTREAVEAVINKAKEMSGYPDKLTTRLRELGGLIRAAGDIAVQADSPVVLEEHVQQALIICKSIEEQMDSNQTSSSSSLQVSCKV
ncbi:ATP-dependent protease LonB [Brevibacillus gelatini]|uniref:ATP-dependent protease LonB n=1 Tax=Brevibacillus gelatini TaxID=1655277 RepID=A0A3M8AZM8_9BACL|nr:ATP-binding protein [Brevibacillus gelatini]RNB56618.1 ATP-dependent protease LonB [Brevibacillus gelatini]